MHIHKTSMVDYEALKKFLNSEYKGNDVYIIDRIQKILNEKLKMAIDANKVATNLLPVQERSIRSVATEMKDIKEGMENDNSFLSDDIKKLIQNQIK